MKVSRGMTENTLKGKSNGGSPIKQGIITPTTKETLLKLEQDKETFEISIAKERIERPILSKNQIKFWICKFGGTNLDDVDEKQRLINVFVNSIYVYNDKMVVTFNYEDGDKCVTFDEINEMLTQKENSQNNNSSESSPLSVTGDPSATRTPDTLIKSQVLCRLS